MKHIQMHREGAEKWLAALRSGEYVKGRTWLHQNNSYCCIGVLQHCLTGNAEAGRKWPSMEWLGKHGICFLGDNGEVSCDPWIESCSITASTLNDVFELSGDDFRKIADAIESELEFT